MLQFFITHKQKLISYYLRFPLNLFVFTGMLIISHLWMENMEESVYPCHQKQVSCKDDLG